MWRAVSEFSEPSRSENLYVDLLDEALRESEGDVIRLETSDGYRALVVSFAVLSATLTSALAVDVTAPVTGASDTAIFVPAILEQDALDQLSATAYLGGENFTRPTWVGISAALLDPDQLRRHRESFRAGAPAGKLTLAVHSETSAEFVLSPSPPDSAELEQVLTAGADLKVPEGPDNLRRRAEWFRRQSGEPR